MLLFAYCGNAWSARTAHATDFTRWLNNEAAPQLAEKLSQHPKFKGATLTFAPAHHNQLAGAGNRLYQNIVEVLSHSILSAGRNNIISAAGNSTCLHPEQTAQYIIGVAVDATTSNSYTVQIRVLDHRLGVWVSGISYRWQGALTRSQKSLLQRPSNKAANGTVTAPFSAQQQTQTARHLLQQIQCTFPAGVAGLIHVDTHLPATIAPAAAGITQELQRQLRLRPQWIFTSQPDEAAWTMTLQHEQASAQLPPQWVLLMTPSDRPSAPQIVAMSYIQSSNKAPTADDQVQPGISQAMQTEPDNAEPQIRNTATQLVGEVSWKPGRRCSNPQRDCVEVTFNLMADAYVTLFRTHNRQLKPARCESNRSIRKKGELTYQISLPRYSPLPTGVYIVASRNQAAFERLHKSLQRAPGSCQARGVRVSDWLEQAAQAIHLEPGLQWQSLHLQKLHGRLQEI
ncbi:MAG: hypothetical protein ACFHXK_17460 [bacterium]